MKILVATKTGQGKRKNDFCFCDVNELVKFGVIECSNEKIDGICGCRRSLCGMKTSKATTTMKVIEKEMSEEDLKAEVRASLVRDGWMKENDVNQKWIDSEVKDLIKIANTFPVNSIIEKRGNKFKVRT